MKSADRSRSVGRPALAVLTIYLILLMLAAALVLVAAFPYPTGPLIPTRLDTLSMEFKYLLVVVSGAALGATIQSMSTLVDAVGNSTLAKSWFLSYFFRVFESLPLALIVYFTLRQLLSSSAQITDLNAFSVGAISVLVGMFSKPAMQKVNEIFSVLFRHPTSLETEVTRIGSVLGLTTVDNYDGYICTLFKSVDGKSELKFDGATPRLEPWKKYKLIVWFQPEPAKEGHSEKLEIEGGTNVPVVQFSLVADSANGKLRPRQTLIAVKVAERSPEVEFEFEAPGAVGSFELWLQITQKNKFIALISQRVNVGDQSSALLNL